MTPHDAHEDLVRLLPFYINGSLGAADCARIDTALSTSADLRAELAALSGLARAVKTGGNAMTQDFGTGTARLEAVLGQLEDTAPVHDPLPVAAITPQPNRVGAFLRFLNPKLWHPAVSLALALAVIGQGLALAGMSTDKVGKTARIARLEKRVGDLEFALASGPDGVTPGSVIVQIKADAPWSKVEALLGKEGLMIVAGPSDGALTLFTTSKGAALDALIVRLRRSPLIAGADKIA
jgi:hypothetical protein